MMAHKPLKLELRLSPERKELIFKRLLENRGLLFLIFFGVVLVYSFNLIYKKTFVEVNYIEYEPTADTAAAFLREGATLGKIAKTAETRRSDLEASKVKRYSDPFNFASGADAGTPVAEGGQDGED